MTDAPQGPGWWLASDGRWYPPEQAPAAAPEPAPTPPASPWGAPDTGAAPAWRTGPTATPPPPQWGPPPAAPPSTPRRTWIVFAVLGGVALVMLVGGLALLYANADTDDDGEADVVSSAGRATGPTVTTPSGTALTLPDGWVGSSTEEGVEGLGATMFPDDEAMAAEIDRRASILPRAITIFGMDAGDLDEPFQDNLNVLNDVSVPAGLSLDDIGTAEAQSVGRFGGVVKDTTRVDLGDFDAVRIRYRGEKTPAEGVAYVVKDGDDTWMLTYSFSTLTAANLQLAEASAATFDAP